MDLTGFKELPLEVLDKDALLNDGNNILLISLLLEVEL